MWISRNRWRKTEKRIADLEKAVRGQGEILHVHMDEHLESVNELKEIIGNLKGHTDIGNEQML